jgi:hypothetical protein
MDENERKMRRLTVALSSIVIALTVAGLVIAFVA